MGANGMSLAEMMPNTIAGVPYQLGEYEVTPVYSVPGHQQHQIGPMKGKIEIGSIPIMFCQQIEAHGE